MLTEQALPPNEPLVEVSDVAGFGEWSGLGGIPTAARVTGSTDITNGDTYTRWVGLGGALKDGSSPAAAGVGNRVYAWNGANHRLFTGYALGKGRGQLARRGRPSAS